MPKYMVVYKSDDGTYAFFTDDMHKADSFKQDAECGMGWRVQIYVWVDSEDDKNDPEDCDQYQLWYE